MTIISGPNFQQFNCDASGNRTHIDRYIVQGDIRDTDQDALNVPGLPAIGDAHTVDAFASVAARDVKPRTDDEAKQGLFVVVVTYHAASW